MGLEPLTNDDWGFESNCFVCEARNPDGLRIPFAYDTDRDLVVAVFTLGSEHSGAPAWVHGGVSLAICDEAMAWAAIASRKKWGVTRDLQATFERPVKIDTTYRIEARITAGDDGELQSEAAILDERDKVRVRTTATLVVYSAVNAPEMIGSELPDSLRTYLREP
ncbi:MAG: PaaI family thioesterase [Actinomycetota bacterium]|nr:PaaI family thioesterase [Actinomycetota bacterium]